MNKIVHKHIILFDGFCNLCNWSVNFIIDRDKKGKISFAALQSEIGQQLLDSYGLATKDFDSLVFISNNKVFQKSSAALSIAQRMDRPWPLLQIFFIIPKCLRDKLYVFVAKNRYRWFGKRQSCRVPTAALASRFI